MEGKTLELPKTWQGRTRGVWEVTGLGLQRDSEIWQATSKEGRIPKQVYRAAESQGRQRRGLGQEELWHWIGSSWRVRKPEDRQSLKTWMLQLLRYRPGGCQRTEPWKDTTTLMSRATSKFPSLLKGRDFFHMGSGSVPRRPCALHVGTHTPWFTLIPSCLNPAQTLERPYLFSSTTSGSQTDSAVMRRESMPSCSAGSQLNL